MQVIKTSKCLEGEGGTRSWIGALGGGTLHLAYEHLSYKILKPDKGYIDLEYIYAQRIALFFGWLGAQKPNLVLASWWRCE